MVQSFILPVIEQQLWIGERIWLFLDYDGTLVPIARTPQEAQPDAPLLELLSHLANASQIRTAILSGRPLASLQTMLPVPGLILAGIYGAEIQTPENVVVRRVETNSIRPTIEQCKSRWLELVAGKNGFLIEDKGLAVALHARFATREDAERVLSAAHRIADESIDPEYFRLLGGDRFLEVAPIAANKGRAVAWLMDQFEFKAAVPVYFGDDDKDEEAFEVVRRRDGFALAVGAPRGPTHAHERLSSPDAVREWLRALWYAVS